MARKKVYFVGEKQEKVKGSREEVKRKAKFEVLTRKTHDARGQEVARGRKKLEKKQN